MREIKFRAWNGMEIKYDVVVGRFGAFYVNPGSRGDGLDDNDRACLTPFNTIYSSQVPIMQFTGRKDENGKEIYEGDICVFDKDGPLASPMVVEWIGSAWVLVDPRTRHNVSGIDVSLLREFHIGVIGNIYENPELLKQ